MFLPVLRALYLERWTGDCPLLRTLSVGCSGAVRTAARSASTDVVYRYENARGALSAFGPHVRGPREVPGQGLSGEHGRAGRARSLGRMSPLVQLAAPSDLPGYAHERESVGVVVARRLPPSDWHWGGSRWPGRSGSTHTATSAQVAVADGGRACSAGRVATTPQDRALFAESLASDDRVVFEATGNPLAIARIIAPRVAEVVMCAYAETCRSGVGLRPRT